MKIIFYFRLSNMLRVALLNGKNRNYDTDISKILQTLTGSWTVSWLNIVSWSIQPWYWFAEVTRTWWIVFLCLVEVTAPIVVDVTGTKKIWIELLQSRIDDGFPNAVNWTGIAQVSTWASYPVTNFLKVAGVVSNTVTDERKIVKIDPTLLSEVLSSYASISYVDNEVSILETSILNAGSIISLVDKNLYITGEAVVVNDNLFPETWPTFAQATLTQAIWSDTSNTRYTDKQVSTGTYSSTFQFWVDKVLAPSTNLIVELRLGSQTGTLLGTATILNTAITTSKVNYTATRDAPFTQPVRGTTIFYVFRQTGDTVNASNFYRIYLSDRNTTTRWCLLWNGTVWSPITTIVPTALVLPNQPTGISTNTVAWQWVAYTVDSTVIGFTCTKVNSPVAIRCRLLNNAWTLIETGVVAWNVATFTSTLAVATNYRVERDNNGFLYTSTSTTAGSNPSTVWVLTILWGSSNWVDSFSSTWINVSSFNFNVVTPVNTFSYINSTSTENTLLSLTDAKFDYKRSIDWISRISTEIKSSGQNVICTRLWLHTTYSGLVPNTPMFLANTPWQISAIAWTIRTFVGTAVTPTVLNISNRLSPTYTIQSWTIGSSGNIDSGWILANKDMVIRIDCFRVAWASGSITVTLFEWLTSSPTDIIALSTSSDFWNIISTRFQVWNVSAWNFYRYTIVWNSNLAVGSFSITAKQD